MSPSSTIGVGDDHLRRVEAEVGGEHRQAHEHLPLRIGEEVVTPRHHRFERALAGLQEPEPVVETRRDLFEGEGPQASGREFDGERKTVETATDLRDRGYVSRVGVETRRRRGRPHHEELDGVGLTLHAPDRRRR